MIHRFHKYFDVSNSVPKPAGNIALVVITVSSGRNQPYSNSLETLLYYLGLADVQARLKDRIQAADMAAIRRYHNVVQSAFYSPQDWESSSTIAAFSQWSQRSSVADLVPNQGHVGVQQTSANESPCLAIRNLSFFVPGIRFDYPGLGPYMHCPRFAFAPSRDHFRHAISVPHRTSKSLFYDLALVLEQRLRVADGDLELWAF